MTDEIRRLLLDIVLLDSEMDAAPSLEDMARRAKAELDRAALAPESGGPTELLSLTSPASEGDVDRGRPRTDAVNGSDAATGTPTRRGPSAPSSPSSAQGEGREIIWCRCGNYEVRHGETYKRGSGETHSVAGCSSPNGLSGPTLAGGGGMSKIAPTLKWLANGGEVEDPSTYSKALAELRALLAVARAAQWWVDADMRFEKGTPAAKLHEAMTRLARLSRAGRGRGK